MAIAEQFRRMFHNQAVFIPDRYGGNYGPLLVTLLVLFVVIPGEADDFWGGRLVRGVFYVVYLFGFRGATNSRLVLLVAFAFAAGGYGISWIGEQESNNALNDIVFIVDIILAATLPALILRNVLTHTNVSINTLIGAASAYALGALLFALMYTRIGQLNPEAFTGAIDTENIFSTFLYYSLVVQTTLGLGDIDPTSPLSRGLTGVHAMVGQLYLVVLIAWLVGLHFSQSRSGE